MIDYKVKQLEAIIAHDDYTNVERVKDYVKAYEAEDNENVKNLILFLIYKSSNDFNSSLISKFDADVFSEVVNAYKNSYPFFKDATIRNQVYKKQKIEVKYELVKNGVVYRGDTMTSMWTTLKAYTKFVLGVKMIAEEDSWIDFIFRNRHHLNISDAYGQLLKLGHTLGNFIPVPNGFNGPRSNFGRWDYWDLTLNQIYQYYEIGDEALDTLFNKKGDNKWKQKSVDNTRTWLDNYKGWNSFVEDNHMTPFLNNNKPVMFYEGHSFSNSIPSTLDEFETLFRMCGTMIEKRNALISQKLKC